MEGFGGGARHGPTPETSARITSPWDSQGGSVYSQRGSVYSRTLAKNTVMERKTRHEKILRTQKRVKIYQ